MVISEFWIGKDLEGSSRGLILSYYPGMHLERLRTPQNLSRDSRSPDRDLNLGPSVYESGALTSRPRLSVLPSWQVDSRVAGQETPRRLWNPKVHIVFTSPEPHDSKPHLHIQFLFLSRSLTSSFPSVSCVHFSSLTCMLHAHVSRQYKITGKIVALCILTFIGIFVGGSSARNGNLEVPLYFWKSKQVYTVKKWKKKINGCSRPMY
jgi:hypothetical protein